MSILIISRQINGRDKEFLLTIECQMVNVVRVLEDGKKNQHFTTIIVD